MNKNPQFTPYKSKNELLQLRDWFYNYDEKDNRQRALSKVSALMTKSQVPHSIESTSLLTAVVLNDEKTQGGELMADSTSMLQLSYTMGLIKFVNGLLDPYQQSNFAIPLHTLATFLKLPGFFVELRHIGTHEYLPSLEMLRIVSRKALEWLFENYWKEIDKEDDEDDEDDEGDENRNYDLAEDEEKELLMRFNTKLSLIAEIKLNFRNFKKIRKMNLNKFIKFGDSSEVGVSYWKSLTYLKKQFIEDGEFFINVILFKNILILKDKKNLNESKINGLRLLYKPFMEELGYEFTIKLFEKLVEYQNKGVVNRSDIEEDFRDESITDSLIINEEDTLGHESEDQLSQSVKWCEYLMSDDLKINVKDRNSGKISTRQFVTKTNLLYLIEILTRLNNEINQRLLENLMFQNKKLIDNQIQQNIVERIKLMKKFQINNININKDLSSNISSKRAAPSLPDIDSDLEILKKRIKFTKNEKEIAKIEEKIEKKTEIKLWQVCENWKPTAYGIPL